MGAYYNEFDAGAAAWLRELIKRGLIADGEVDERSILDVSADDLRGFTQCHFFAGIGGWSYALRLAGWPDDKPVWTGSPPCQPFSAAGQQKGKDDERHLAPHFAALVASGRPPILFGEQVSSAAVFGKPAKRTGKAADGEPEWAWIDDLFGRLEAAHYACGAVDLPAAGVGAPHIRQRAFFGAVRLADADGEQCDEGLQQIPRGSAEWSGSDQQPDGMGDPNDEGSQEHGQSGDVHIRQSDRSDQGRQHLDAGLLGGLADAQLHEQRRGRGADSQDRARHEPRLEPCGRSEVGGLADADGAGRQLFSGGEPAGVRSEEAGSERSQQQSGTDGASICVGEIGRWPSPTNGGWADADWLFCRDGKWRPVEPGTFPLAHGLPARVVRLRGYGNAIVPQAAAALIKIFREVIE